MLKGKLSRDRPAEPKMPNYQTVRDSPASKKRLVLGMDFRIERLDASNVASSREKAAEQGKRKGEKLFQQAMAILKDDFPPNERENEDQYREYFYDEYSGSWFVNIAVSNSGEVIGLCMYDHRTDQNIYIPNLVAVHRDYRRRGIGKALMSRSMEECRARTSDGNNMMVLAEIEVPDDSLSGEQAYLTNVARPAFHDNVTKLKAIRLPSGEPLIYSVPVMATDEEREEAAREGNPLEPAPLLFCMRSFKDSEDGEVGSREVAKLLVWFYKGYLELQCHDVKSEEVDSLLAETLGMLAPEVQPDAFLKTLQENQDHYAVLDMVPEMRLQLSKIGDIRKDN